MEARRRERTCDLEAKVTLRYAGQQRTAHSAHLCSWDLVRKNLIKGCARCSEQEGGNEHEGRKHGMAGKAGKDSRP